MIRVRLNLTETKVQILGTDLLGPQGPAGPQGAQGPSGIGADGEPGQDGQDGAQGIQGTPGPAGRSALDTFVEGIHINIVPDPDGIHATINASGVASAADLDNVFGLALGASQRPGFRYLGNAEPDASAWLNGDLWLDTSKEDTTGQRIRRWDGSEWHPALINFGATGGVVTNFTDIFGQAWAVHTFLATDGITFIGDGVVDIQLIGGAGGSSSGGSGAGEFLRIDNFAVAAGSYSFIVGTGGNPGTTTAFVPGQNGYPTSALGLMARGGGGGASPDDNGHDGGSGGGAGGSSSNIDRPGGLSTAAGAGIGHAGGLRSIDHRVPPYPASGGGGAGTPGGDTASTVSGNGGAGFNSDINGTNKPYAAGGGGMDYIGSGTPGIGGSGIGGSGGPGTATQGLDGTGSGSGGVSQNLTGVRGAHGSIIVRYKI